ncbi:MAG TPA: SPOR domain-containing protein [Burkholderiales bacterium]
MRAFFLLLVLVNLAFFAYGRVALEGGGSESRIPQLQVAPESIKLLQTTERVPAGKPQATGKAVAPESPKTATAAPGSCLEWGNFAGTDVARAEVALTRLQLAPESIERAVVDAGGYWVYMPPLRSKNEVDRKVRELREFGVTEFFVVQDAGQWRNAISLGIFRTDEAAQAFLAGLRRRGVRSAVVGRRDNFLKQVVFYLREPSEATIAQLTALQEEFPGSEIRAATCPLAQPAG